jgi:Spy/CpxP family protein refolding chaperone
MWGRLVGIAVLSACVALPAAAQKPERQQQKIQKIQKRLSLSDEQMQQVRELLKARGKKQGKQDFRSQLRGILTPEQVAILDQKKAGKKNGKQK